MTDIAKADAYGGVLVSAGRKVLLCEPANHFGGYVWTFPKGRPDPGETPAACALREVWEETGYRGEILGVIPGVFAGTTSSTAYFLMGPLGRQGKWQSETTATAWVDDAEAARRIGQTTHASGRKRDLAVLAKARALAEALPWSQRPATTEADWPLIPMSATHARLMPDLRYDACAMRCIAKGRFAYGMGNKWFIWFDGRTLHVHRSWTGNCIFEADFALDASGGAIMTAAHVCRDPAQYTATDDAADLRQLERLIQTLLVAGPEVTAL